MFLSITDLQLRNLEFDLKIAPGKLDLLDDSLRQEGDLVARGTVSHRASTREILVEGFLSVVVSFACDRCLERARKEVRKDFSLLYLPEDLGPLESEREIGEAEADIGFYAGDGLELDDILRELVILEIPMRRVCEPACAEDPEKHLGVRFALDEAERADSRWSALSGMVPKDAPAEEKPGKDVRKKSG
jgi:uncharacterized protein